MFFPGFLLHRNSAATNLVKIHNKTDQIQTIQLGIGMHMPCKLRILRQFGDVDKPVYVSITGYT